MTQWFRRQFHQRASARGEQWFGRRYKGGQFLPFYVPRPVMPQINEEDYAAFIEFAAEQGVDVVVRYRKWRQIRPHQRLDKFKAERMPTDVAKKPVFVSQDWFILDGNHRWCYHRLHRSLIPCFEIKLSFADAIALMFAFPKTYALEHENERN